MIKKLFIIVIFFTVCWGVACAYELAFPKYSGFVNDYAGVLNAGDRSKIELLCKGLESKTGAELAVAVVKTVIPLDPKMYAVKLFEDWKIGKKGKDNGVLILLAMDERRVEIEVGYGLEGILNDAYVGQILDESVVPYLKRGEWGKGLFAGASRISETIIRGGSAKPKGPGSIWSWILEAPWYLKLFMIYFVVVGFGLSLVLLWALIFLWLWPMLLIVLLFTFGGKYFFGRMGLIWGFIIGMVVGAIVGRIIYNILGIVERNSGSKSAGRSGFGGRSYGGGGRFGGFGGGRSGGGGSGRGF